MTQMAKKMTRVSRMQIQSFTPSRDEQSFTLSELDKVRKLIIECNAIVIFIQLKYSEKINSNKHGITRELL